MSAAQPLPALQRFAGLVTREQFDLAEACLLIAADAYPSLDVNGVLEQIEAMAETVRERIAADAFAEQRIAALNHYLFDELGFHGNVQDYYDPRNSYLNEVIERKTGIPITLSILYMELGRRIGVSMQGVAFPGHFLVKLRVTRGQLVLDPFAGGEPQSEAALRKRLAQTLPPGHGGEHALDRHLDPASPRQIIARVLRNLKAIHSGRADHQLALGVLNRLLLVMPEAVDELRDRGLTYERLEAFRAALSDLENYLRRRPDATDAIEMHAKVVDLRLRCSRLN
jgi:regulator of sirC expression with transglutaminase-like and TPR domain